MTKRPRHPREPVYSVTGAPQSLEDDQRERMRRYLTSMGIRTLCFILSVVFLVLLHWTIAGWVMVVGAAVLPYFAVVMANVTKARLFEDPGPVTPPSQVRPQIGPGDREGRGNGARDEP